MTKTVRIGPQYGPAFSRAFSPVVLDALINSGQSKYLNEILSISKLKKFIDFSATVEELFEWLYRCLNKSYRNEYVYKNAIVNKILLGQHSLKSSHMLTEFRAANCKADVVILNGTSTVYEIKSEYDSLDRLSSQIAAYSEIFDSINVITSIGHIENAKRILPSRVGLMLLTPEYTIRAIRKAISGKANVKPEAIFDSLRKSEYVSIINRVFGSIPAVPNTHIYRKCKDLFCTLTPQKAHDEMVRELLQRDKSETFKEHVDSAPQSLKAYAISSRVNNQDVVRFKEMLLNKSSSILSSVP